MREKAGMLAVMTPTWISTSLAIELVSENNLEGEGSGERIVRHKLNVEEGPSRVLGIIVQVAEVDAHCGGYDGSTYHVLTTYHNV